jgi:hypothetical protein
MIDHARVTAMKQAKIMCGIGKVRRGQRGVAPNSDSCAAGMGMSRRAVHSDECLNHLRYVAWIRACCCFVHHQPLRDRQAPSRPFQGL